MKNLPIFPVLFLLIFACTENTSSNAVQAQTSQDTTNYLGGTIPIYDSFEDAQFLFSQNDDTTYVINFWATWCKPCVEELPYFEQLNQEMSDEKVKVVLISMDFPKKLETLLLPFVKERALKSHVVALTDSDHNSWISKVDPSWSGAIPITIVYRKENRTFKSDQFASYEELKEIVKSKL